MHTPCTCTHFLTPPKHTCHMHTHVCDSAGTHTFCSSHSLTHTPLTPAQLSPALTTRTHAHICAAHMATPASSSPSLRRGCSPTGHTYSLPQSRSSQMLGPGCSCSSPLPHNRNTAGLPAVVGGRPGLGPAPGIQPPLRGPRARRPATLESRLSAASSSGPHTVARGSPAWWAALPSRATSRQGSPPHSGLGPAPGCAWNLSAAGRGQRSFSTGSIFRACRWLGVMSRRLREMQ